MPQATWLQSSLSGQRSHHAQPTPSYQGKAGTPPASRKTLLQQPDKAKGAPHHIPRLRAVVESQAFKNILVDEMDMMESRAATLIQANWRGHQLRRKLTTHILAAKGVHAAWRRFNTKRRLRYGKAAEKKSKVDEENIPYHPPQLVRFQHAEEDRYLLAPPVMVNKETQFPSDDSLAACALQLALLQPPGEPRPDAQATGATGGPTATFLPHQTSLRLPCPVGLNAKYHPCLLTRTVRSTSLSHSEGDWTKTKKVTGRASKAGALGLPCERIAQTLHAPLKTQAQAQVEIEVLRAPPQAGQASSTTKTPLHSCLASTMHKPAAQHCPRPRVTIAKTPPQLDSAGPVAKTTFQSCLAAILNKIPAQPRPISTTATKTPPQPSPAAPMTKTPAQMRPTALRQPAAMTSVIKPPAQTCPVPVMAKPPLPLMCPTVPIAKSLLQTCPGAATAKTPSQTLPGDSVTQTPSQTLPGDSVTQTPSQTLPGDSVTQTPTQTRLAAMIIKTPAQLRSVATVIRNLCLSPPADGNLDASPPAAVGDGIPNTPSSHTDLNRLKAKAVVTGRQMAGSGQVSSHSHLAEGKVKFCPPPHLGAGAPKAPSRPFEEAEKIKAFFSQKQVKMTATSNTSVAKVLSQEQLRADVPKVRSQGCAPVEMAVVLPQAQRGPCPAKPLLQAQKATCPTTASPQRHMLARQMRPPPQANIARCLSKPPSQVHPPAKLTPAPTLAHPGTCLAKTQSPAPVTTEVIKVQSQAHPPARLTKAHSQAQLATETAKCLCSARQAAELGSKTRSQPLLAGFKASTQPCQHVGSLCTLSRAKPEDRLTQLPAHGCAQDKATKSPCQGASKTQTMLVPRLVSIGPSTCNVESWGDSRAPLAQPLTTSPAAPCQEELGAAQLASLCAELAATLGSQEDIRALLAKALPRGEARAALNQALLSKEVLGTTMAKALPPGMLGTALVKALSWGELGTALSRALSQGELRAELTKAIQNTLVEVLSKVLTEQDRAALSQAVCQGELGTVLSQSLSQAALQTELVLPRAASKTMGSGMTVTPVPVKVDSRRSGPAAWGPTMGRVRPQPSKVSMDPAMAGGPTWNGAIPSAAVEPVKGGDKTPCGARKPPRCDEPRDAMGLEALVDPRRLGLLVTSVRTMEMIILQAAVVIQACARGYLVRRTIRVWHQWAAVIQAAWRGYCARRDLARLLKAAITIQASWRGLSARRHRKRLAQLVPLLRSRAEVSVRTTPTSGHRCFQACQPRACAFCQSLSTRLGSVPSAVMLVGASPRTCHTCGYTLPTRVVKGTGRGTADQGAARWGQDTQLSTQSARLTPSQMKAATLIQAIWRGFVVRRRLMREQVAAKILQATWRGHYTRSSLTTDALLRPAARDGPQDAQWPGV
uniref:IQ motif containing N n=1 Tax=Pipistrellus kuhlii TaxID=59472 RepID=A0A7J7U9U1_PIPKU|nr:IQ motif containing N [Pipistrellus kuhlii]